MNDIVAGVILMIGALFCLVAAIGLVRLPDIYIRMHAATKAGALGAGMIMLANGVHSLELEVLLRVVIAVIFIFLTAPIAAHLLGRASYLTGVPLWSGTVRNDLAGKYDPLSHDLAGLPVKTKKIKQDGPNDMFPVAAAETLSPSRPKDPVPTGPAKTPSAE
ncbi:MAG: monovalent cation/H(+) antiporter subunit G [Pseudomonadota bacterium]